MASTGHRIRGGDGPLLPRLNTRLPLFEITFFCAVIALGWAAYHTYHAIAEFSRRTAPQLAVQRIEIDEAPEPTQVVEIPGVSVTNQPPDIQEILRLQGLLELKDRYTDLADRLEPALAELREALQGFLRDKDRGEIGRYRRQSQALAVWVQKQQDNLDSRKQQSLRDWLSKLSATNASSVVVNLDLLLAQTGRVYSNYLSAVPLTEGMPLSPDLVQMKLLRGAEPEQELLGLARRARTQAGAVEAFVKQRQPAASVTSPQAVRVSVTRPSRPVPRLVGDDGTAVVTAFNQLKTDVATAFQPLFYVLAGVLLVQSVLLIVALYTRIVVAPLRQKIIEDNTAIEHQRKLDHFARLATTLAHEIRNPLTAINVRLFTLQKSLSKSSSEHGDAVLIRNEIDRLEQILKNFLKLARPSEPRLAPLTAEPVLREVCELLAPQLKRQSIELKLGSTTNTRFQADPLQLKQVLINLIQNAADSIGQQGTVTLRAKQGDARLEGRPTGAVIIEVEDTGSGIEPDVQERLFDPFFSTKDNGTGLGLPIAVKIIDQHKGTLDFDTRPGHGTTFRVILPQSA